MMMTMMMLVEILLVLQILTVVSSTHFCEERVESEFGPAIPALYLTAQCGQNVTTLSYWRNMDEPSFTDGKLFKIDYTCYNKSSGLNFTKQITEPGNKYTNTKTIEGLKYGTDMNVYCVFRACIQKIRFISPRPYLWNEDTAICSYEDVHGHIENINDNYSMPDQDNSTNDTTGEILLSASLTTTEDIHNHSSSSKTQQVAVTNTGGISSSAVASVLGLPIPRSTNIHYTSTSTSITVSLPGVTNFQATAADENAPEAATTDPFSSDMIFVIVGVLVAVIGSVVLLILLTVCFSYRRWLRKTTLIQYKHDTDQKFDEPVRSVSFYGINSNSPNGSSVTVVHSLAIKQSIAAVEEPLTTTVSSITNDPSPKLTEKAVVPSISSTSSSCDNNDGINTEQGVAAGQGLCTVPPNRLIIDRSDDVNGNKKTVANSEGYIQKDIDRVHVVKTVSLHSPLDSKSSLSHVRQDSVFDGYLSTAGGEAGGRPAGTERPSPTHDHSYQSYSSSSESAYVSASSMSANSSNYLTSDFTDSIGNMHSELGTTTTTVCESTRFRINNDREYIDSPPPHKPCVATLSTHDHLSMSGGHLDNTKSPLGTLLADYIDSSGKYFEQETTPASCDESQQQSIYLDDYIQGNSPSCLPVASNHLSYLPSGCLDKKNLPQINTSLIAKETNGEVEIPSLNSGYIEDERSNYIAVGQQVVDCGKGVAIDVCEIMENGDACSISAGDHQYCSRSLSYLPASSYSTEIPLQLPEDENNGYLTSSFDEKPQSSNVVVTDKVASTPPTSSFDGTHLSTSPSSAPPTTPPTYSDYTHNKQASILPKDCDTQPSDIELDICEVDSISDSQYPPTNKSPLPLPTHCDSNNNINSSSTMNLTPHSLYTYLPSTNINQGAESKSHAHNTHTVLPVSNCFGDGYM